jgi:hypothetical protein
VGGLLPLYDDVLVQNIDGCFSLLLPPKFIRISSIYGKMSFVVQILLGNIQNINLKIERKALF